MNPLPPLRQNLARSAQAFGLKLDWIRLLGASKMTNPVPHRVYTDQRDFRLTEDQLITRLKVDFEVSGQEESLRRWKEAWQAIRSPDPRDGDDASTPIPPWLENARIRQDGVNRWRIQAIGFVFRDIRFPRLEPRDPVQLLPEWARERPEDFKAQEPLLWSFVERTKLRLPEAAPLYRTRERFLLNDARWRFFNSRVMSKRPS